MRGFNECMSRLVEIEHDLAMLAARGYRVYGIDDVEILHKVYDARQHLISAERTYNPVARIARGDS